MKKVKEVIKNNYIVLLDNIRSSENVGSILRTSDALGVSKVICCGITPTPKDVFGRPNKKIIKAALGAEQTVSYEYAGHIGTVITKLKKDKYTVIGIEQGTDAVALEGASIRVKKAKFNKIAFVLGSETDGISKRIQKKCDVLVEIPMFGIKESLNVSVAYGIAAYVIILGLRSI